MKVKGIPVIATYSAAIYQGFFYVKSKPEMVTFKNVRFAEIKGVISNGKFWIDKSNKEFDVLERIQRETDCDIGVMLARYHSPTAKLRDSILDFLNGIEIGDKMELTDHVPFQNQRENLIKDNSQFFGGIGENLKLDYIQTDTYNNVRWLKPILFPDEEIEIDAIQYYSNKDQQEFNFEFD